MINNNLNILLQSKQDIKNAIINKGVTPAGGLVSYSAAIDKIESSIVKKPLKLSNFPEISLGRSSFTTFTNEEYDFSGVTDMSFMFSDCNHLINIPLIDTSSCTDMSYMFRSCDSLTTIPLIDTSKVTDMDEMFQDCQNLTSIPLIDTSSCTDMHSMFWYCTSLTNVPVLNTSNVTDMSYMFFNCISITNAPLIDISKARTINNMFEGCTNLIEIKLKGGHRNVYCADMLNGVINPGKAYFEKGGDYRSIIKVLPSNWTYEYYD